jgi:iron(III) transport system ATP-binding protein
VGTPQEIYDHSATEFVCNFIGDSSALTPEFVAELNRLSGADLSTDASSYLRVEKASLNPAAGGGAAVGLPGTVVSRTYHGLHSRYVVRSHGADIRLLVREDGGPQPEPGSSATVYLQPEHILQYHRTASNALEREDQAVPLP